MTKKERSKGTKRKRTRSAKGAKKAKKTRKKQADDPFGLPDARAVEGGMYDFFGGGPLSAVDEAQNVMYDAWDASTATERVALARRALEISADCADAYVLLAEETAASLEEATDLYRRGVEAGERAIGPKTFEEDAGYFWGLLETRPYMRARAGLAQCLWEAGRREDAVAHYQDMLRLNPDDNQGIRDALAACLVELGRDAALAALLKQYEADASAAWLYTAALLAFRQGGDTDEARRALGQAIESNPHVPAYLAGKKQLPPVLPEYIGLGDENEAVCYAADHASGWAATPGALDWLAHHAP